MSKIAIKGATTGTGVFTLESPATNTDRTLVLPDEAGTVLTSVTGGGVYVKNNIIGTVSQSGGVPTGAIIEHGNNANGEYLKYADGTMICWKFLVVTSGNITTTLPAAYANTDTTDVVTLGTTRQAANGRWISVVPADTPTTEVTVKVWSTANALIQENASVLTIGRWY